MLLPRSGMVISGVLVILALFGLTIIGLKLRSAPGGFEDVMGFHLSRHDGRPEANFASES